MNDRRFIGIDLEVLTSIVVADFSAGQRSVLLALYELANWAPAPWPWHGSVIGTIERGELTHALRSIAQHAKVSKDVADGVVSALLKSGYLEELLAPTKDTTQKATSRPTHKSTTPRKLRLVHYLRKRQDVGLEPTSGPTSNTTSKPTTEPTEIRETEEHKVRIHSTVRAARIGPGHPAFEAIQYWTETAWPMMSPSACSPATAHQAQRLAALIGQHGVAEVKARMDRAAADLFWRDKLDLDGFIAKFDRFARRLAPAGGERRGIEPVGSDWNSKLEM